MEKLTRAEEEIMQIVWKLGEGFLREIMDALPDPKPAPTTVATVLKILEGKGYISYTQVGKNHRYLPLIEKSEYASFFLSGFMNNYFEGSTTKLLSFFVQEGKLSLKDLDEILKNIEKEGD